MRPTFVHRPALGRPAAVARVLAALLLASTSLTACVSEAIDQGDEALGDIGDGKSDSFGIVDYGTYVYAGTTRHYTFTANAAFRLTIAQPSASRARSTARSARSRSRPTCSRTLPSSTRSSTARRS